MTPVLDVRNVSYSYGANRSVLDGTTVSVSSGESVALLGRNGTGKTTLIRLVMGLLRPQAGMVRVFGLDPIAEPVQVKSRLGYVSEDQLFPSHASVSEILDLYRSLYPAWDRHVESNLMERFALPRGQTISGLSKGQARQVALICALAHRPELLILDEPAGGLDPAARRELLETSLQTLQQCGSTILFSSHHMADVERLGGRILLMDEGRIRLDDQLASLHGSLCLAVVPQQVVAGRADVELAPGCLGARPLDGYYRAVFRGSPETVRAELKEKFQTDVPCSRVNLEEMFVELLGGKR